MNNSNPDTKKPQLRGFVANSLTFGVAAVNVCIVRYKSDINTCLSSCARTRKYCVRQIFAVANFLNNLLQRKPCKAGLNSKGRSGMGRANSYKLPTITRIAMLWAYWTKLGSERQDTKPLNCG